MKKTNCPKSVFVLIIFMGLLLTIELLQLRTRIIAINSHEVTCYDVAEVLKVVDGDTLEVSINGDTQQIRLIGIDCPELNTQYGIQSKSFTSDKLLNTIIYLEKDNQDKDKYNRMLRYVWTKKSNKENAITEMFNAQLLEKGYANVMNIPPNTKYKEQFLNIEKEAQENKLGIWKPEE